jgi:hypothetical protein
MPKLDAPTGTETFPVATLGPEALTYLVYVPFFLTSLNMLLIVLYASMCITTKISYQNGTDSSFAL